MPRFEWSKEYGTGIAAIDDDHKALLQAARRLEANARNGASHERLAATMDSLVLYAAEHFAREERYFDRSRYPNAAAHKAEHARFAELATVLKGMHSEQPDSIDIDKVLDFLAAWLNGHILGPDKDYVPWVFGKDEDAERGEGGPDARDEPREEIRLAAAPDQAVAIREFAAILGNGGEAADVLAAAVHRIAKLAGRSVREQAAALFRK